MKALRNLKMMTIALAAVAVLAMHSTALASECEFEFRLSDAWPCVEQYEECLTLRPYSSWQCVDALGRCGNGMCLTLHPFCDEECEMPTMPGGPGGGGEV